MGDLAGLFRKPLLIFIVYKKSEFVGSEVVLDLA